MTLDFTHKNNTKPAMYSIGVYEIQGKNKVLVRTVMVAGNVSYYTIDGLKVSERGTKYEFVITGLDENGHSVYGNNKTATQTVKATTAKFVAPKGKAVRTDTTISSVTATLTLPAGYAADAKAGDVSFLFKVFATVDKVKNTLITGWGYEILSISLNGKGVGTAAVKFTGLPFAGTKYTVEVTALGDVNCDSSIGKVSISTAKYTAVKVANLVKYSTAMGTSVVEATLIPPGIVPVGAAYETFSLYQDRGRNAAVQFVPIADSDYRVVGNILMIDWSKLGLADTASNKFVLRAVTDSVQSMDTPISIKFSTLKTKM